MSKSIHIYGFHSIEAQLNSNPECILNVFVQTGRSDIRMSEITSFLNTQKITFQKLTKTNLIDSLRVNLTRVLLQKLFCLRYQDKKLY